MDKDQKSIVLIVEDDEFLRVLTAKRLEKEGFKVAVAVDGERFFLTWARKKTLRKPRSWGRPTS